MSLCVLCVCRANRQPAKLPRPSPTWTIFKNLDLIIVQPRRRKHGDLWSFNEEIVARAIYNSLASHYSAVGHQINTTLSDLVADVFVETPSAAAKIIVDKKNALLAQLDGFRYELDFSINDLIGILKKQTYCFTHMLKKPRAIIWLWNNSSKLTNCFPG